MARARADTALQFIPPQLATLVAEPPTGAQWLHEVKYDGYRLQALIAGGSTRLFTRRGLDWTDRFADNADAINKLRISDAIIDGELVALDAHGRSTFQLLQQNLDHRTRLQDLVFFAFDLLRADGESLRALPLAERRKRLAKLIGRKTSGAVRLSEELPGPATALIREACRLGLEGIICKDTRAPYLSGRSASWVKVKCGKRQEFVILGFTEPKGSRTGLGSLMLGVNDNGTLRYAGRVGTGIPFDLLASLRAQLDSLRVATPPVRKPAGLPAGVTWVNPKLVAEVSFSEWTDDGLLRHPSFEGLREDKPASEVKRESPQPMTPAPATPQRKSSTARHSGETTVAGVKITHPERVIYPDDGITKLELAQYLERMAPRILPHVAGRPLAFIRCPEGIADECFFQKHWPGGRMPSTLDTVDVRQSNGVRPHIVVNTTEALVTLAQWGIMEIHTWGSRADDIERPDRIVFDLDPDEGVTWNDVRTAARAVREVLDAVGLQSWLKTSGGKGVHVVVPLGRRSTWDDVSAFAEGVAERMAEHAPDRFVAVVSKAQRKGKIFVDWLRNTRGATAIAAWCPRARPGAGVSMPIPWDQLSRLKSGDQYTLKSIRAAKPAADPWADMEDTRQALTKAMVRAVGAHHMRPR